MKYIVFCVVFAGLVAVSFADNLLAESTSSEQVSPLSRKGKLERARVAKKISKGNAEASEDDGTELIELKENSEAGFWFGADAPAQGHYFEVNSYKTRTTDVYEFHDYANDKRLFNIGAKKTWKDYWAL